MDKIAIPLNPVSESENINNEEKLNISPIRMG